jgi:hypothetical protein
MFCILKRYCTKKIAGSSGRTRQIARAHLQHAESFVARGEYGLDSADRLALNLIS